MTSTFHDNPQPGVQNVAQDHAQVGVQVGVVHGDATFYQVSKEAPPQRKYEVGVNFLRAGVARRAEELICEAVMSGYASQAVAYHWILSILSGQSFEYLGVADLSKLQKAREIAKETPRDAWSDATDVVTGLLDCAAAQEINDDTNTEQINLVVYALQRLPGDRFMEITGHLDMLLSGTLQDQVEKLEVEHARKHRKDDEREIRVPLFFEPEPAPPRPIFRRPTLTDANVMVKLVFGLVLWGIGIVGALPIMFSANVVLALLATVVWTAGCAVFFRSGPEWLLLRRRSREAAIPGLLPSEHGWVTTPVGGKGKLFHSITRAVNKAFLEFAPAEEPQRTQWGNATSLSRAILATELTDHYQDVKTSEIYWLIKRKAQVTADLWRRGGTVTPAVAPPSSELTGKFVAGIGLLALATMITTGVLLTDSPGWAFLLAFALIPGTVLAFLGAIGVMQRHIRDRIDRTERERRLAKETVFYQQWKAYLDAKRPTDAQMGQWLDYDLRHLKSAAMEQYGLSSRDIIAHVILTEPGVDCLRARYVFGPPRYSMYIVTIFLLTGSGVRQWSTTLKFDTAMELNQQRQSFRYDAIAMAKVAEVGATVHGDRRYFRVPRAGDLTSSKLLVSQALRITLVGGDDDAINILIENFSEEFSDTREQDKRQLYDLAIDSSGITGALRVLEAVAADGKQWIERDHDRRRRHAHMYVDKEGQEL